MILFCDHQVAAMIRYTLISGEPSMVMQQADAEAFEEATGSIPW